VGPGRPPGRIDCAASVGSRHRVRPTVPRRTEALLRHRACRWRPEGVEAIGRPREHDRPSERPHSRPPHGRDDVLVGRNSRRRELPAVHLVSGRPPSALPSEPAGASEAIGTHVATAVWDRRDSGPRSAEDNLPAGPGSSRRPRPDVPPGTQGRQPTAPHGRQDHPSRSAPTWPPIRSGPTRPIDRLATGPCHQSPQPFHLEPSSSMAPRSPSMASHREAAARTWPRPRSPPR